MEDKITTDQIILEIEDYVAGNMEENACPDRMSFTRFLRGKIEQARAEGEREEREKILKELPSVKVHACWQHGVVYTLNNCCAQCPQANFNPQK